MPRPSVTFWKELSELEASHRARGVRVSLDPGRTESGAVDLWIGTDAQCRGAGLADAALTAVLNLADKYAVTVTLVACPTELGEGLPDAEKLAKWYERHGFIRLAPSRSGGGIPMRREPVPPPTH